jgi:hypothetical protein
MVEHGAETHSSKHTSGLLRAWALPHAELHLPPQAARNSNPAKGSSKDFTRSNERLA